MNNQKPYENLTYRGQMRRLKQLALKALEAYGIMEPEIRLLGNTGNIVYKVFARSGIPDPLDSNLYVKNTFALRLHWPGYQSAEAVDSELSWLSALRGETGLPVVEPVPALNGALSIEIGIPGVPQPRRCSLLRWVNGRNLSPARVRPAHLKAAGRLMAQLHQHAAQWEPPPNFTRPIYDWEGLYGTTSFSKVPPEAAVRWIPGEILPHYQHAVNELAQVMAALGTGPDVFGLIHADLCIGENLLYRGRDPIAVDFDDCAFGYWLFDIGVSLAALASDRGEWIGTTGWERNTGAFLEGYTEIRPIPPNQRQHLRLFSAAWHAFEIFWAGTLCHRYPDSRAEELAWIYRAAGDLRKYLG